MQGGRDREREGDGVHQVHVPTTVAGMIVRVPGHVRSAADALVHRSETQVVALGPHISPAGGGSYDDVAPYGRQVFIPEAQLGHRTGSHVVDHDVAVLHQPPRHVAAFGL